jgi:hypothetical protein
MRHEHQKTSPEEPGKNGTRSTRVCGNLTGAQRRGSCGSRGPARWKDAGFVNWSSDSQESREQSVPTRLQDMSRAAGAFWTSKDVTGNSKIWPLDRRILGIKYRYSAWLSAGLLPKHSADERCRIIPKKTLRSPIRLIRDSLIRIEFAAMSFMLQRGWTSKTDL